MKKLSISVLVTARGNNTLSRKHLIDINGKKLIEYPLDIMRKVKNIDNFYISSDDEEILEIGNAYGYNKIKRSEKTARPDAQHIECIIEALDVMREKFHDEPDILVVVLGNTVYFESEWVEKSIELIKTKPERVVYVSCDPSTLARDLKYLASTYSIESVTPFDMFPQTYHVETIVLLCLKDAKK